MWRERYLVEWQVRNLGALLAMTARTAKGQRAMHRAVAGMTFRPAADQFVGTNARTLEDGWTPDDVTDEYVASRATARVEQVMMFGRTLEQHR